MSEAKLKALKVVDLKDILAKASVSAPAKANKQELIARILASPAALAVYNKQQNPNSSTVPVSGTTTDDLVCASTALHCTKPFLFFPQLAPPEEQVAL
jgi:SAP domain-containing ribonucleoprotein